jgi:hypothetical protein
MSIQSSCASRASDNKWSACPPRMEDGRLFTDYRPRCAINLEYKQPTWGSYDFRQYLIHNGDAVIAQDRAAAFRSGYCGPCAAPYNIGTMHPEQDAFVCDRVTCERVPNPLKDPNGLAIGTGREYGILPSNQAQLDAFLAEQGKLQNQLQNGVNCCSCGGDEGRFPLPALNYTGAIGMFAGIGEQSRYITPSGATPPAIY